MSYDKVDCNRYGDQRNRYILEINVMLTEGPTYPEGSSAYNGVKSVCKEATNNGRVKAAKACFYNTDNRIDCDNYWSDGNQWLDNHDLDEGDYGEGVYLWVTNCDLSKAASPPDGDAFIQRRQAFVGANRPYYEDNFMLSVMAIHEGLHPYLAQGCEYVNRKFGNGGEHSLGHSKFENGKQRFTPMCASYERDYNYGSTGNCSDGDDTPDGHTRGISICTEHSLKSSWKHIDNQH